MQDFRRQLIAYFVLVAVSILVVLLPVPSVGIMVVNIVVAQISAYVVIRSIRKYEPNVRWPWYLAAFICGFSPLSIPVTRWGGSLTEVVQPIMDGTTLVVAIISGMGLVRARLAGWPRAMWIDTGILLSGVVMLAWSVLLNELSQDEGSGSALGSLFAATFELTVLGIVLRVVATSGESLIGASGMPLALLSSSIGNTIFSGDPADGTLLFRLTYVLWAWPGIVIAIGATHSGMRYLTQRRERALPRFGRSQVVTAGLALAIIPVSAMVIREEGRSVDTVWMVLALTTLSLVLFRFLDLVGDYGSTQRVLAQQTKYRAAVVHLGQRVMMFTNAEELIRDAVDTLRDTSSCQSSGFFEWDQSQPGVRVRATAGVDIDVIDTFVFPEFDKSAMDPTDRPFLHYDDIGEGWSFAEVPFRSLITALIQGRQRSFGILSMWSSAPRSFAQNDVEFLQSVAVLVATALERFELEVEIRQAQKSESIGRLAAGVAHEINTPVQVVSTNMHFVEDGFKEIIAAREALRSAFGEIAGAAELQRIDREHDVDFFVSELPLALHDVQTNLDRTASIVRAMTAFGAIEKVGQADIDINEIVRNTLIVTAQQIDKVADVETDLGEIAAIREDPGDMNQVVLNVLINAVHAIEDRQRRDARRGKILLRTWESDDRVMFTVTDDGVGIADENVDRVFDPFFTTKDVGRGAGQGLTFAQSVLKRSGGSIDFTTSENGTAFSLRLPAIKATPTAQGPLVSNGV